MEDDTDTRYSVESFRFTDFAKTFKDWRLPENRIEAFTRVCHTRMMEGELDHWLAGKVIADYMELTKEQKAWYCLLFGFSYRNHWAMIVLQLFPDIGNVSRTEIEKWYNDSPGNQDGAWRRVCFGKDTKWNVRKFPHFIESVQRWLHGDSLYDRLEQICSQGSAKKNFETLNSALCNELHGIGRMTSWLTIQTIYEFFDFDLDYWDLQLDNPACWSQFNSLCYLFDHLEWADDTKYQKDQRIVSEMNANATYLMNYINEKLPYHFDIYNCESVLCEFKKTAKGNKHGKVKEFTGWTWNEGIYDFQKLWDSWKDHDVAIDWTPYILAIETKGKMITDYGFDPIYFKIFSECGLNFNTHRYYDDEPNAFEILRIPDPLSCPRVKVYDDEVKRIKEQLPSILEDFKIRFDPKKHLRVKS